MVHKVCAGFKQAQFIFHEIWMITEKIFDVRDFVIQVSGIEIGKGISRKKDCICIWKIIRDASTNNDGCQESRRI